MKPAVAAKLLVDRGVIPSGPPKEAPRGFYVLDLTLDTVLEQDVTEQAAEEAVDTYLSDSSNADSEVIVVRAVSVPEVTRKITFKKV